MGLTQNFKSFSKICSFIKREGKMKILIKHPGYRDLQKLFRST